MIDLNEISLESHAYDVKHYLDRKSNTIDVIFARLFPIYRSGQHGRRVHIQIPTTNGRANTETMIAMMNGDRFATTKQHLVNVLLLVKAAALPGAGRDLECDNCGARESSLRDIIMFRMDAQAWSNCVGCALK